MGLKKDNGFKQATKNDSRVTKVGNFLRQTSLDEIPQFINAFLGQMSIVGPRPHPIELDQMYNSQVDNYMVRHLIKPGITGLSQVMGFRGETKDAEKMKKRIRLDIFYIENWSFFLDIKTIIKTAFSIFKRDKNVF